MCAGRPSRRDRRLVVTTRGPGHFLCEVALLEDGTAQVPVAWQTNVKAQTPVAALHLTRGAISQLLRERPEAAADLRAAMSQVPALA